MTPALMHVPPMELGRIWPHLRDRVTALSELPGEDWIPEHVFFAIMEGETHLFTTPDFRGFLITQVLASPYSRTLHVWLASNEWAGARQDFFEQIKSIAEANTCSTITWRSDRMGWLRALPGVRATTQFSYTVGD